MSDNDMKISPQLANELGAAAAGCTQAICCDVPRVYDSCADKDCIEDLRVYFTDCAQKTVDCATSVRCRKCEIISCYVDVEPTPFNKGFYSVDATFFFKNTFDVFTSPSATPLTVCGLSTFTKKCILYGSEGSVKVFSSEYSSDSFDEQSLAITTNPRAKVQAVDPICLAAELRNIECCCDCCNVPVSVGRLFDGSFRDVSASRAVFVTIGMFIIVQLERDVQMLMPAYDFCIPQKECCFDEDTPCDVFRKIQFPVNEFFPPNPCANEGIDLSNGGCCCG